MGPKKKFARLGSTGAASFVSSVLLVPSMRRIAGRHGRNDRTTHLMNEQEKWPVGVNTWQYLYGGCGDVTSVLF